MVFVTKRTSVFFQGLSLKGKALAFIEVMMGLYSFMGLRDNKILKFCRCAWLSVIIEQTIPKLNGLNTIYHLLTALSDSSASRGGAGLMDTWEAQSSPTRGPARWCWPAAQQDCGPAGLSCTQPSHPARAAFKGRGRPCAVGLLRWWLVSPGVQKWPS